MTKSRFIKYDVRDVGYALNWEENNRERTSVFPSPVNPCEGTTNPVGDMQGYFTAHRHKSSGITGTKVFGPNDLYLRRIEYIARDYVAWKCAENEMQEKQRKRA